MNIVCSTGSGKWPFGWEEGGATLFNFCETPANSCLWLLDRRGSYKGKFVVSGNVTVLSCSVAMLFICLSRM